MDETNAHDIMVSQLIVLFLYKIKIWPYKKRNNLSVHCNFYKFIEYLVIDDQTFKKEFFENLSKW